MYISCFVFSIILNTTKTHNHLCLGPYGTERSYSEGTSCEQGQIYIYIYQRNFHFVTVQESCIFKKTNFLH